MLAVTVLALDFSIMSWTATATGLGTVLGFVLGLPAQLVLLRLTLLTTSLLLLCTAILFLLMAATLCLLFNPSPYLLKVFITLQTSIMCLLTLPPALVPMPPITAF